MDLSTLQCVKASRGKLENPLCRECVLYWLDGSSTTMRARNVAEKQAWMNTLALFPLFHPEMPRPIPTVFMRTLQQCLDHLARTARTPSGLPEGIFRLSGNDANLAALFHHVFVAGESEIPSSVAPAVVAMLIKALLRRMPETLLTDNMFKTFIQAAELQRPELLKAVISALPPANRLLLARLVSVMSVVAESEQTRMHARNLAVVVGPNLLSNDEDEQSLRNVGKTMPALFEMMLLHKDALFPELGEQERERVRAAALNAEQAASRDRPPKRVVKIKRRPRPKPTAVKSRKCDKTAKRSESEEG